MKRGMAVVLFFFLLAGIGEAARLTVFVNMNHPGSGKIYFKVKSLSLLDGEGNPLPLDVVNPLVSTEASFGQVFLTGSEVPNGPYTGVSLTIGEAGTAKGKFPNAADLEVKVPARWELKEGESRCLFITWDVQASLRGNAFHPNLYAMPQGRPLGGELLYVTCDDINTLFAIRTDTNRVVASLATKGRPGEMAAFPRGGRLYVLCEESRSLLSVGLSSFRVIDTLVLPMVLRPRFLALVDGRALVISDPSNNQIVMVAPDSGSLLKSRRLGQNPTDLIYWEEGRQLFVSSTGEQRVYQLDRDLRTVRTYGTGSEPRGIWVQRSWLYVADSGSGTISIFNLRTGRLVGRVRSGRTPVFLMGNQRRLFVCNQGEGTLGVLRPGQMSISKKVRIGGTPSFLTICGVRRWIYVVDRKNRGVVVVNSVSLKKEGVIFLGNLPYCAIVSR